MNKILPFKYPVAILAIACWFSLSCTKFVALDPPATQVEASLVFSSDAAAVSALTGLYSRMTQSNLFLGSGAVTLYPGQSADECYNAAATAEDVRFSTNSLVPDNGTGNYIRLWRSGYQIIYNANAILAGLDQATGLTDSVKAQVKGEALVIRSLCYFYLANLYGAVPLALTPDYETNQALPRTPGVTIYTKVATDLRLAKSILSYAYPSPNRSRPNRITAAALLARVYLYQKNWSGAATEATDVIQSGTYSLNTNLTSVFLIASPETIWQLARDNGNTGEGFAFLPTTATVRPAYVLTTALVNSFEPNDKRKLSWIGKNTVGGTDYYYPSKYKVRATTPITESYIVFRLAEQYLIRAEARALQNDLTGAKADLDIIRGRAGLTPLAASTQTTLLSALEKERQTELFLEWGHRWQDLIRWGRADAVLGIAKGANWQSTDQLYPIPLGEIQKNSSLIQNPGY